MAHQSSTIASEETARFEARFLRFEATKREGPVLRRGEQRVVPVDVFVVVAASADPPHVRRPQRVARFLSVRLSFARVIESERVDESAGRDVPHDDAAVEGGGGDEAAGVDGEGDDRATGRRGRARARGRAETRARL